jgi:ubiquinone/menaquinone biosynthesis C-methylase UbiE
MSLEKDSSENSVLQDYERIWEETLQAQDYQRLAEDRLHSRSAFYRELRKTLVGVRSPVILEVGCGTSIDLNVLGLSLKGSRCFGTDLSLNSIAVSRKVAETLGNRTLYFVADTSHLPVKSECFDLVYSQGLLEHFQDPIPVAQEQARVLKKGGVLIINVPQKYTGYTLMKRRMMRSGTWKLGWETEFSYWDLKRLGQRLALRERKTFGYQYWKSWREPLFVLRDLYDKAHRRNPLRDKPFFQGLRRIHESFWKSIERIWGHYFLQNIVIVLEKPLG